MKDINLKLDLNGDPRSLGALAVVVFIASQAGARLAARRNESPRRSPYTSYDRISRHRGRGGLRATLTDAVASVIDRGVHGDPQSRARYYQDQHLARRIDRMETKYDNLTDRLLDNKREVRDVFRNEDGREGIPEAVVETKDGNPVSVLLENRTEAQELVATLGQRVEDYEAATVTDFYDLIGVPSKYVDSKWGWTSVSDFVIEDEDNAARVLLSRPEKL